MFKIVNTLARPRRRRQRRVVTGREPAPAAGSPGAGKPLKRAPMAELFVVSFVTYFVVIDPLGVAPVFASLTEGQPRRWTRTMAVKSVAIATLILFGFAAIGDFILGALHIGLDAFRLAGGVLLFLIALDMIFEKRSERREERAEHMREEWAEEAASGDTAPREDISVFPMALPMLAGPGGIATVLLYMSDAQLSLLEKGVTLAAMAAVLALALALFLGAGAVMRLIGVILAALAAQLILDSLSNTFAQMG